MPAETHEEASRSGSGEEGHEHLQGLEARLLGDAVQPPLHVLARRPIRRGEAETLLEEPVQLPRDLRQQAHVRGPAGPAHGREDLAEAQPLVRQLLCKHLPHDDSEAVNVGRRPQCLAAQDLGAGPVRGPAAVVRRGEGPDGRVAEVADARDELPRGGVVDQDVRGLEIRVHEVSAMQVDYASTDRLGEVDNERDRQLAMPSKLVRLVDQVKQRTVHELGHDVMLPGSRIRAYPEKGAYVRVVERGHDACLFQELVEPDAALAPHLLHGDEV
mmetsp:Transcript_54009/g.167407  ORF Transcript_54009/g.167407 Transcript_54009/m.167407 type:complete len:272 (-) Transcript_54009:1354-2169(-)